MRMREMVASASLSIWAAARDFTVLDKEGILHHPTRSLGIMDACLADAESRRQTNRIDFMMHPAHRQILKRRSN